MKTKVLTLVLVGALASSSLAMAGELSSADSDFMFGKNQVAATTISAQEMQKTQGQTLKASVNTSVTATGTIKVKAGGISATGSGTVNVKGSANIGI